MKKVIVGSTNPIKLLTTQEAFSLVFPKEIFEFETYSAESNVPDQPIGSVQTREGANNRALNSKIEIPGADFYVGLEGGIEKIGNEYWVFAWMCVLNNEDCSGYGKTSSFMLPPGVAKLIEEGKELGHATDIVFNETNSKHKGGTVAILTNEIITRKDFYREAMIFALIPFIKPDLYPAKKF